MNASVTHRRLNLNVEQILKLILTLPATSYPALLDSCHYRHYRLYEGRYLIAAFNPELCLQVLAGQIYEFSREGERLTSGNALIRLDQLLAERATAGLGNYQQEMLPCAGGAALGFFSYDLSRNLVRLSGHSHSSHIVPDLFVCFYNTLIIYDYLTQETTLIVYSGKSAQAEARLQTAQSEIERLITRLPNTPLTELPSSQRALNYYTNFTREDYLGAVVRIQEHISAGNIYQANFTQQFQIELNGLSPAAIFLRLRAHFPVPYMAYLRTPDWAIVSASPERFLHRIGHTVAAYPIKGTRPRGRDASEDRRLSEELRTSEKDRAENIMIVDLMRNDLGRVSEIGSIDASELLTIQALPTVFHLVSKVSGQLRREIKLSTLLEAAFPCGSITGAPKLRAMEIIEEIEGVRRGLSMGALGWLGYDGNLDLNVAIRTLWICKDRGYFNVGGAIVADSDPANEYEESLIKAQALLCALGLS
ncbi:MAG: aminodeoxychorismate synthase component I [Acidobacteriota bacterium]